jgi:hypothetical protein
VSLFVERLHVLPLCIVQLNLSSPHCACPVSLISPSTHTLAHTHTHTHTHTHNPTQPHIGIQVLQQEARRVGGDGGSSSDALDITTTALTGESAQKGSDSAAGPAQISDEDERNIVDLLVDQIEFANVVILNKVS